MRKAILVLALLGSCFVASAQQPTASDSTYIYSCLSLDGVNVCIDSGDGWKLIKDKNGNTLYFKNTTNALNYLVANGWEYVERSGWEGAYIVRKKYPKSKVKKLINPIP